MATKLEAFGGRGRGDFLGSHDLEDILTVFDGRAELPGEIAQAPANVRDHIAAGQIAAMSRSRASIAPRRP